MIWYLIDAFKEERRINNRINLKKISKEKWKYLIILMTVAIFYFISMTIVPLVCKVYWLQYWVQTVSFFILIFTLIYFVRGVSREAEKEYEKNVLEYKDRLRGLRDILKKDVFKLYSERKVARLIEDCDRILPGLQNSKTVFKPISAGFTAIIFPLIVSVLGVWMYNVPFNISSQIMALIILILIYLVCIFQMFSDQNLRTLTNDELRNFLEEVFQLIDTKFAPEEIKDDTKASFASWRIKKGAKELQERNLLEKSDDELLQIMVNKLRTSFLRYPYKLLLLDSYIIFLMENYNEFTKQELKELFVRLRPSDTDDKEKHPCGIFLRTRMLFTIAANWSSLPVDNRQDVKVLIYAEVKSWYGSVSPCWHEQIAVYWLFTVADITWNPHLANTEDPIVEKIYNLWKLNKKDTAVEIVPALIMTMSSVLKRQRMRDPLQHLLPSREIDWIKWIWSNLEKRKPRSLDAPRMWLELTYGRETIVPQFGFKEIINIAEKFNEQYIERFLIQPGNNDKIEYVIPIFNGAIEIIDRMIVYWLAKPGEKFVIDFENTIREFPEESKIREYIIERMYNLTLIRMWLCQEIKSIPVPDFVATYRQGKPVDTIAKRNIPLKDWLDAVEVCQQLEHVPEVMLPLNEMEITGLILAVKHTLEKHKEECPLPNSLTISLTKEQWLNWRKKPYEEPTPKISNVKFGLEEDYCSPWVYFGDLQLDIDNTNTPLIHLQQGYPVCYSLANLMLRLLARRKYYTGTQGIKRLRGWINISDVISMAAFPSSCLAEIIAGALNYQRPLYEYFSEQWSLSLSLLPMECLPIDNLDKFENALKKYREESCYKYGLEIKPVDLDAISRW